MRKAERLFQLTNFIRVKQPVTAKQISEELSISVRTVYRYIDDLSVSGIPVYGTTGIGYKLDEHFELPPLNLTESELEALMLGVDMVCRWTGDEFSRSAKSLSHKIEAALPTKLKNTHHRKLHVPMYLDSNKVKGMWETVHFSISENIALMIEYQDLNNEYSTRTIYPLGLFFWGGKWTVGSWCTLRENYRDFRLDRIIMIKNQDKYVQTKVINFNSYVASFD